MQHTQCDRVLATLKSQSDQYRTEVADDAEALQDDSSLAHRHWQTEEFEPKRVLMAAPMHFEGSPILHDLVRDYARRQGYNDAVLSAADDAISLQRRLSHPAGKFDDVGRFFLAQRFACCATVRSPSSDYPHTEMVHGRSLRHVAHLHDVPKLHVQRMVRALEAVVSCRNGAATAHIRAQMHVKLRHILKRLDTKPQTDP